MWMDWDWSGFQYRSWCLCESGIWELGYSIRTSHVCSCESAIMWTWSLVQPLLLFVLLLMSSRCLTCHFLTGWDGLKEHRIVFEQKLPTPEIVSRLHAKKLLLDCEYSEIKCKRNNPVANRKLIDFLLCKDDDLVKDFKEQLSEIHGYSHLVRLL